ncbi:MAG: NAD-dependent deacylase [Chitinophagales bacterium]|nr:NAD-dependent deacylase [Chitinophagales bacterium]HMV14612.1 NAD-dependent deacylase [Chitinophagales bacterium]HMW12075.1 NAD-dependent deacylase [Chitinophagales bacterium]HMX59450.1 NAD-dependent deacylase [Chitinophagales bacterium]HMY22457.1 NAD-dependent deacylase [Chitinophagales bacterium]
MDKKNIVILSGAGISAESGIKTFRDGDGLWENHRIEEVATYDAWLNNRDLVLEFYNQRRKQLLTCEPNDAHRQLVILEEKFNVQIITQNVDDLHERAGSKNVLHLHGELLKVRSTADERLVYDWKIDLVNGDKCEKQSQLRPHIVWFGEPVPMMDAAAKLAAKADIFIVIGTSLVVYPAAGLLHYTDYTVPKYVIDPNRPVVSNIQPIEYITEKASIGVRKLVERLMVE